MEEEEESDGQVSQCSLGVPACSAVPRVTRSAHVAYPHTEPASAKARSNIPANGRAAKRVQLTTKILLYSDKPTSHVYNVA